MARRQNNMLRKRLIGSWLSSLISISLVLLLMGAALLLTLGAGLMKDWLKENIHVTAVLKNGTPAEAAVNCQRRLEMLPYVKSTRYVSVQEGTAEMAEMLGPDFLEAFDESPVPSSIDVAVKAAYMCDDSLDVVIRGISREDVVEEVSCRRALMQTMDDAIAKWTMALLAVMALMLFISIVLISGTVRLSLYSNRFSIRTMELVGATDNFIAKPYVGRAALQGLLSALIACALIGAVLYAVGREFPQTFEIFSPEILALSAAILVAAGVLVCVTCSRAIVRRIARLEPDEIYG